MWCGATDNSLEYETNSAEFELESSSLHLLTYVKGMNQLCRPPVLG